MAGAFTHFIICDVAKRAKTIADAELKRLLNKHSEFLFLGAASPDLPYLSFKTGNINWADLMHYEKTNGIALNSHQELKRGRFAGNAAEEIKLIWLMGFVSHLVADATIHPIVQAIVGPYEQNKEEHRLCEMTQDSLIYHEHKNTDIRYAEFSSAVKFCGKSEYFNDLMDFWTEQALKTYSDKNEDPNPALWFTTYAEAIDTAEGGSGIVALFRHLGIGGGFIYKTQGEILSDHLHHYEKYFAKAKMPDGNVGMFLTDGFERAVSNVVDAWNKLYAGLNANMNIAATVKNWNLDTGVDMATSESTVTYWV
jgi:hypothetical protein